MPRSLPSDIQSSPLFPGICPGRARLAKPSRGFYTDDKNVQGVLPVIRIAIVEDDTAAARRLCDHLDHYAKEAHLDLQYTCYSDGQDFCSSYNGQMDVLFLDVQMPRLDGFAAARAVRRIDPSVPIVFLTNAAQYAIRGYEVDAVDYIVKPLQYEVFCMKFDKVLRLLATHQGKSILVSRRGETQKLLTTRIWYIEIFDHQLSYHTADGTFTQTGATSLGKLEEELADSGFARCHNCYLVNLQYVDKLEDTHVLVCGKELPVSRTRKKAFSQALMDYYRGRRA